MPDEMFLSKDGRSLRRGKRAARRTGVVRPCAVWLQDDPEIRLHGLVLNVSPYGMLIRMRDSLPPDTKVTVQLLRYGQPDRPFSLPIDGAVVRNTAGGSFTDHGVRLVQREIQRAESRPIRIERRLPTTRRTRTRMHTIDYTVGDEGVYRR